MTGESVLLAAGSNSGGQLGLGHDNDAHTLQKCQYDQGSFPPVGLRVLQLSAGSNHAVGLLCSSGNENGDLQVWACGSGSQGQLGKIIVDKLTSFRRLDLDQDIGLNTLRSEVNHWQPVRVACGWNSTFIVMRHRDDDKDDILVVMGKDNDFGQLGLGEMKRNDVGVGLVQLRQGNSIQGVLRIDNIACGLRHAVVQCYYMGEGMSHRVQVLGWGAARHGQLDLNSTIKYPSSYWYPHLVEEWDSSMNLPSSETILAAGKEHTMYRHKGTSLRLVGSNRQGQRLVYDATATDTVTSAACTWNATLVLLGDSIVGSGKNDKGQLGVKTESGAIANVNLDDALQCSAGDNYSVASLVCGSEHTMVLIKKEGVDAGQVWGWGWNEHGNLAQNNEEDQPNPVCIWPQDSNTSYKSGQATDVWAGCGTTFIQIQT